MNFDFTPSFVADASPAGNPDLKRVGAGQPWTARGVSIQWQPFRPGDTEYKPLVHKITCTGHLPADIQSGWHQIGLWLPDTAESLRLDSRYAIRVANRDVPWWTDPRGNYGINLLGVIEAVP